MTNGKDPSITSALDGWRFSGVDRDWASVLVQAGPMARPNTLRVVLGLRRRRLLVAVALVAIAVAAPALAVVGGVIHWPESRQPGAQLGAAVSGTGATVTFRSHGSLLKRRGGSIRFFAAPRTKPARAFVWQLSSPTRKVSRAEIRLDDGFRFRLCAPCRDGASGRFILHGSRALSLFNGQAALSVVVDGHKHTARVVLRRFR